MEAIILAGGQGTRLQSVVSDVPKPMAAIQGRPFLDYLLKWLENNTVSRIVLSTGYKSELIKSYYGAKFGLLSIEYSVEDTPLGTGGAIKEALQLCHNESVFVINGDTFFDVDLSVLQERHLKTSADITIALKEMQNPDRYGTVCLDNGVVTSFCEKQNIRHGLINGGVYVVTPDSFARSGLPTKFSFENDFLHLEDLVIHGVEFSGSFIDIGCPEDYALAQKLIPQWVKL